MADNKSNKPKRGLGKGLSALIPDTYVDSLKSKKETSSEPKEGVLLAELSQIIPNPDQPRTDFKEEQIEELSQSIQEQGILQPLVVKRKGDQFEIICGERRFRASQKLGLEKIPIIVKDIAEEALLEVALIENIQREDLNAFEEARAYLRLVEERGYSQEEIAKRVGKKRSTVANSLRLLGLPNEVRESLIKGDISQGHARAILALSSESAQILMAKRVISEGLSVRQVEELIQKAPEGKRRAKKLRRLDSQIVDLETKLEQKLGTQVRIFDHKGKGRLEIRYFSLDQLEHVLQVVGVEKD